MCVTWMMVAIVAPIFQGIAFRRCRPLHGSYICYIGVSSWVCEGHVQEGWTLWWRKPGFDVYPGAASAQGGRAYLVARLYAVAAPGACSHTAECIFLVVVPAAAAATMLLAGHGRIDVAALHVLNTVTSRGWDAWVGACGSQAKLTTTNTVSYTHLTLPTILLV